MADQAQLPWEGLFEEQMRDEYADGGAAGGPHAPTAHTLPALLPLTLTSLPHTLPALLPLSLTSLPHTLPALLPLTLTPLPHTPSLPCCHSP